MKNIFTKPIIFFALIITLGSCNINKDQHVDKNANLLSADNSTKLGALYSHCLFAVRISEEAMARSISPDTKIIAGNVINENNRLLNIIKQTAANKNVVIELDITADHKKEWKALIKNKAWKFDETYAALIGSTYKELTSTLKGFEAQNTHIDLKQFANIHLPDYLNTTESTVMLNQLIASRQTENNNQTLAVRDN